MTPEEVAGRLKVKHRTVLNWLQQGKLRGVKLAGPGGVWRIRPADLEVFLGGEVGDKPKTG